MFRFYIFVIYIWAKLPLIYHYDASLFAVREETEVWIVATIAWGLRKCSRAIMLVLIFLIAVKPGFIHAVYSMLIYHILLCLEQHANIFS